MADLGHLRQSAVGKRPLDEGGRRLVLHVVLR